MFNRKYGCRNFCEIGIRPCQSRKNQIKLLFKVLFDQENPQYGAGSELSGTVVVKVEETAPVRGLKLKLSGKMELYWRKVEGGNTIEFAELEDYLDDK